MTTTFIIQRAVTTNNVNGNPRRVYVVHSNDGNIEATYDEGYLGFHAVPKGYREEGVLLPDIQVTPKEYRRLVKTA